MGPKSVFSVLSTFAKDLPFFFLTENMGTSNLDHLKLDLEMIQSGV